MRTKLWAAYDLVLAGAIIGVLVTLASGCTITTSDNAEIGFRFGTEGTLFQRTSETKATSKINLAMPSVEEWLFKDEKKAEPAPTTPAPTPEPGVPQ